MKYIPIAPRSTRGLSFALAITMAFQFISPLVFATEQQNPAAFLAADSSMVDNERLEEDAFLEEDALLEEEEVPEEDIRSFNRTFDSTPTLDSSPPQTPVPGDAPAWHEKVNLKATISNGAGTGDVVLDSGGTPPIISITPDTTKLKIQIDFGEGIPNTVNGGDLETGEEYAYTIRFSKNLVKLDVLPPEVILRDPDGIPVLHARLTKESDGTPILKIWLDADANNLSNINAEYDLTLALKPLDNQNPSHPEGEPIIEVDNGPSFTIKPYETTTLSPELKKTVGDETKIADPAHPIEWKLQYKTGRMTPDGVTPAYVPREIKIVDTIDTNQQVFDNTNANFLQWTNNNGTTKSVPVRQAGDDTKDQSKLPFYEISGNGKILTIYLPDTPNNTTPGNEWSTLTVKAKVKDAYFINPSNQGKTISNTANLTAGGKSTGNRIAQIKLPKWIEKSGDKKFIDTARVDALPKTEPIIPIAWKVTINPAQAIATVPAGTELIDTLPKGLRKIVSVREVTGTGTYIALYAPGDTPGITANFKLMANGADQTATGNLSHTTTPSGTLTYTYPSAVKLYDTDANGVKTGKKQEFLITALVDVSSITGAGQNGIVFANKASLKMPGQSGGYDASASIGVSTDHTLLNKWSKDDVNNRRVHWIIDVNKVGATMTNPRIVDNIKGTQKFIEGGLTVYRKKSGETEFSPYYPGKGTLTLKQNADDYGWEFDFGIEGTTTDTFRIEYRTYVPHPENYPNGGPIWVGAPNTATLYEGAKKLIEVSHTQGTQARMLSKAVLEYDPTPDPTDTNATKRRLIKWRVVVNYQRSFLETPVFSDVLPEGLEYKDGTFTVQLEENGPIYKPEAGFVYNPATRELTYDFSQFLKKPRDSAYDRYYPNPDAKGIAGRFLLEFQTYVPETLWETSKTDANAADYKNTAKLTCANTKADASSDVNIKAPTINKTGADVLKTERVNGVDVVYVEWVAELNRNAAKLDKIKIVDNLPEGLLIDYTLGDAFKPTLEAWSVVANGNEPVEKGDKTPVLGTKIKDIPLVPGTNSFYEPDPARPGAYNLRIELKNLLAEYPNGCGFKLTYRALPIKGGTFNNKIRLEGLGANAHEGSDDSIAITDADVSGNAFGMTGGLTVKKNTVEPDKTETEAKDIEFTLSVSTNGQKIASALTQSDGKALFHRLRFGTYTVTETQAPEGYWPMAPVQFTVNKAFSSDDPPLLFKNYANQIYVMKKDTDINQPLAGAQFQLYTAAGEKVGDAKTTDANGMCSWVKLADGKYYVEEIAAPAGYVLSDVKRSAIFEVSRSILPEDALLTDTDGTTADGKYTTGDIDPTWNKTPAFVFDFSNARTGSVSVIKRDTVTKLPLAGAQFGLYKDGVALPLESKSTGTLGTLTFETPLTDKTTYEVREQLAPQGYLLGGYTSGKFTTDFSNQSAEQRFYTFEVTNLQNLVTGEKVSSTDTTIKLPGAVFGLYQADGTLISTATSDANGRFSFIGVPAGAYIQEITPPAGYQLNTQTRYSPNLTTTSTENPPLYTFSNTPTPSGGGGDDGGGDDGGGGGGGGGDDGGGGGGGGGDTPLLPSIPSSSSSSAVSSSSGISSGGDISSRPLPEEDDNGQIRPGDLTPDEVGDLLDQGYRPTRDVPFGLTREEIIKMIIDEDIPLGKLPPTGDVTGRIVFPLILMSIASACITGLCFTKRKKRKQA